MVYTNKIYYNKRFLPASLLQYVITSCPIVESLLSQRHVQGNVTSKNLVNFVKSSSPKLHQCSPKSAAPRNVAAHYKAHMQPVDQAPVENE